MDLEQALRDLTEALSAAEGSPTREARFRPARQVLVDHSLAALRVERPGPNSTAAVARLAADSTNPSARRDCAVLMLHALATRGLVPAAAYGDVCTLVEFGLRAALLRCGYPFGGTIAERMAVLERLHRTIGELMQPWEPTFPNWQGLYAG